MITIVTSLFSWITCVHSVSRCLKANLCERPKCSHGEFDETSIKTGYCPPVSVRSAGAPKRGSYSRHRVATDSRLSLRRRRGWSVVATGSRLSTHRDYSGLFDEAPSIDCSWRKNRDEGDVEADVFVKPLLAYWLCWHWSVPYNPRLF